MIMKGIWGRKEIGGLNYAKKIYSKLALKNSIPSLKSRAIPSSSLRIYLLYTTIAISFLIAGMFLAAFVLHPWSMMLLLVVTWIVTTAVTTRLWFSCVRSVQQSSALYRIHENKRQQRRVHIAAKINTAHRMKAIKAADDVTLKSYFPVTPMPATPLVRVLETIDLSSTDVEHFVNGESGAEERVPKSQMAFPIDELMSHMDAHINE